MRALALPSLKSTKHPGVGHRLVCVSGEGPPAMPDTKLSSRAMAEPAVKNKIETLIQEGKKTPTNNQKNKQPRKKPQKNVNKMTTKKSES